MIYEPAEDSYLLAESVKKYARGSVLDIGTGSGIQAKTAASLKAVKKVLAVDIQSDVVASLKKEKLKKITVQKSDLFSAVKGKFDTIVFNPPYLPLDEREAEESRYTTTGGKKGYEVLQQFLYGVNDYLVKDGICLILFSSLTRKEKVDAFIDEIGYEKEKLSEQALGGFETLYVYKITRNQILQKLFSKNISNIRQFAKGKRGVLYCGMYKGKKVAIKAQRPDVKLHTVSREADLIPILNKHGIAPKFLFKGDAFFCYEFIEGVFIKQFLEKNSREKIKRVLLDVMQQCRALDVLKITKEEMHNPYKHVVVGKKIALVDFERAHKNPFPQNVTQFCQYVIRNTELLHAKGSSFDKKELMSLAQQYKKEQTDAHFNTIKKFLQVL